MASSHIGQPLSTRGILDLIGEDLAQVEREIGQESIAPVDAITTIGRYLHSSGGKRLRPTLLLLAARLAGRSGPCAIRLAAVVEMIHAATLVHDDVIDIAQTRRGRPSTNVIWGNHMSVLAGDWLYMRAFEVALRERNFQLLEILTGLTQRMVEGELFQLERIGRIDITEADYMELVDRKTASLFSACARLGALVGGASHATAARLGEFAWNLGIAFQLVDDVLDFTSDEAVLGKPVGSDLREGKVTLALIYALEKASAGERGAIQSILDDASYRRVPFSDVLAIIERCRGLERAIERAHAFREKAHSIIAEFSDSPYQRALAALTDLVTERDH